MNENEGKSDEDKAYALGQVLGLLAAADRSKLKQPGVTNAEVVAEIRRVGQQAKDKTK